MSHENMEPEPTPVNPPTKLKEYFKRMGLICPWCGEGSATYSYGQSDMDWVEMIAVCRLCGQDWQEVYTLKAVEYRDENDVLWYFDDEGNQESC